MAMQRCVFYITCEAKKCVLTVNTRIIFTLNLTKSCWKSVIFNDDFFCFLMDNEFSPWSAVCALALGLQTVNILIGVKYGYGNQSSSK